MAAEPDRSAPARVHARVRAAGDHGAPRGGAASGDAVPGRRADEALEVEAVEGTLADLGEGAVALAIAGGTLGRRRRREGRHRRARDLDELARRLAGRPLHRPRRQVARRRPPRPARRGGGGPSLELDHDTMVAAYLLDPGRRTYDLLELAADARHRPPSRAGRTASRRTTASSRSAEEAEAADPAGRGAAGLRAGRAPAPAHRGARPGAAAARGRAAADRGPGGDGARGAASSTPSGWPRIGEGFGERIGELEAEIYELAGKEFTIGSPQQVGRGPLRRARPDQQAPRQDRLLDRRPRARPDPRRAPDRRQDRALARADQAEEHLPRLAAGADRPRDRPHPHHLQPDRDGHRAALQHQPQPAEHPDPHRGGAARPRLLRRRAGRAAALGRLQPGRAAGPRPRRRRGGAEGDLRRAARTSTRRPPPRSSTPTATRSAPASARRRRWSTSGSPTASPAYGLADRLNIAQRRPGPTSPATSSASRRSSAFIDETIAVAAGGGLRDDADGAPAPDPRAALGPPPDARPGRAARRQHADPGHRRRHHQGRDGARPPRARRGGAEDPPDPADPRRAALRGPARRRWRRRPSWSERRCAPPSSSTPRWRWTSASARTGSRRSRTKKGARGRPS